MGLASQFPHQPRLITILCGLCTRKMAQGGSVGDVVSKVELSFSCTKLRDLDVLSKSDPMCVLYSKLGGAREWTKMGRTEMIKDNLNPKVSACRVRAGLRTIRASNSIYMETHT